MNKKSAVNKSNKSFLNEAKIRIQIAIDRNGPYSHNIASLVLSKVSSELGKESANLLVDELELDLIFGIKKVN